MKLGRLIGYDKTIHGMTNMSLLVDIPYKVFATTVDDVNYEDVSSMEEWDECGLLDWARRRDEISPLFYAEAGVSLENFAGMSTEKKLIACKYFLVPYAVRTSIISDAIEA